MRLDENLTVIHAYLCADGYVIKNRPETKHKYYEVGLRNKNIVLLTDFQERFEKIWGIKPILVEGERCHKHSKEIYNFLNSRFGSFYSWEWRMPRLSKRLSRAWLRTYFDCEGWVSVEKHKSRLIGADCVNHHGLKQVKEALAKNNITSKLKKNKGRNIFRLYIYGKENLLKFSKCIGFNHPQKRLKLQQALQDYVVYDWAFPENEKDLIVFVRTLMKDKAKIKSDNGTLRIISKEKKNLLLLGRKLRMLFAIRSKTNEGINGLGTHYYQLNVYKKHEVEKAIKNNLLNEIEEKKWLNLRK